MPSVIPLDMLQKMFANIRRDTTWDMDGPMLWGYFFFDPNRSALERLAAQLHGSGYSVVDVEQSDEDDEYRLHAERVEVHTPESLYVRNGELTSLAHELGVAVYDGMDVGPVPVS